MSARDALAKAIMFVSADQKYAEAGFIIRKLATFGYSIVHKDEIHAPSVERAIGVALAEPEMPGEPPEAVLKSMLEAGPVENARASCRATKKGIAAALRELMKEVGRG